MLSKLSSKTITDLSALVLNVCDDVPDIACKLENLISETGDVDLLVDEV